VLFLTAHAVDAFTLSTLSVQTLEIKGILPPPLASRFALVDRNTLLYDGVSTYNVGTDGTIRIENLITGYRTNSFGQADNSYLQVETMFLLMAVLRRLKSVVTTKFARMKLAQNGARFAAGASIVTPNIIAATMVAEYRAMEREGLRVVATAVGACWYSEALM